MAAPITHPENGLLWEQPDWLAEVEDWTLERVGDLGAHVTDAIERVHLRWWSTVLRVPTSAGDLYFKAGAPTQAFEPALVLELARARPALVPSIVAAAPERGWILMRDGGRQVRELIRSADDLWRLETVLPRYGDLQLALAPRAERLLELGVPDLRLASLPTRLSAMLDDRELLLEGPDGLSPDEHARLVDAIPEFEWLCGELASFGIPETIQHDDLHDGNVLVRAEDTVVFDWGDSCVSHPFHTLTVLLRGTAWRYGLAPGGPEVLRLRNAYLEPFGRFGRHEIVAASAIAYRTGTVARALAWHRFVTIAADPRVSEEAGAVPYGLRRFLAGGELGAWE